MTQAIFSGFLLGMALVFSVGPVIFNIIRLRINQGFSGALFFIAGVWVSDLLLVLMANFFGHFFKELVRFNQEIGMAGGVFLIGLGVYNLFFRKITTADLDGNGTKLKGLNHAKLMITGFLINTLNPSVIALWLAASTNAISMSIQEKVALFGICLGLNIAADILKIYLSGKWKHRLTEKSTRWINIISGVLFVAFGLTLFFHAMQLS
jgi:threonine/homoserine/homoserine lactone efflux protein